MRIDASGGKQFSVSEYGGRVLTKLDSLARTIQPDLPEDARLSITYYVSPELRNLSPQTRNIFDFLREYAAKSKNVSLKMADAKKESPQFLSGIGITGQEINLSHENQFSVATVYSGIALEFENNIESIPFILSADRLEYELNRRVLNLIEAKPLVYLVLGGELTEEKYTYALSFIETAGFTAVVLPPEVLENVQGDLLSPAGLRHPLALFGTSRLTREQAGIIERFMTNGGKLFCAVSHNEIDLTSGWTAFPIENDTFIPALKKIGIEVGEEMVLDISCFRLTLYEDGHSAERGFAPQNAEQMDYPQWISLLRRFTPRHPLTDDFGGLHIFWGSPLTLDAPDDAAFSRPNALLRTSPAAWLMSNNASSPFVTNPFLVQKSGSGVKGSFTVGAISDNAVVVSGQYFAADDMIDYIGRDTKNLDFFVNALLWLKGENELLALRQRRVDRSLHKVDGAELARAEKPVVFFTGIIAPLFAPLISLAAVVRRKR